MLSEIGTLTRQQGYEERMQSCCFILIHLNWSASVIGESLPAISLLFMPKTLDMNDIGNW